jgi:uncharacterized low-complexity protein
MMNKKIVSMAIGTAFAASLSAGIANAAGNPFGMSDLQNGYQVAMSSKPAEGKCGEGKCGGDKSKKEGKCGGDKSKKEGKCGGDKSKKEGKCGEGKCGGA